MDLLKLTIMETTKDESKNRLTQKKIVLQHLLEFGCITPNEAIYKYNITRLADVIYRLKKDGYTIKEEDI